jgi:hypothetical protein
VTAAAKLAKELGFREFCPKKTSRFFRNGKLVSETPIHNNDGEIIGELRPPTQSSLVNIEVLALKQECKTPYEYNQYLRETPIDCKAVARRNLFVSAHGLVFPCCWTSPIYSAPGYYQAEQIRSLVMKHGGLDFINALKRPLHQIIQDKLFSQGYPSGWERGSADRLLVCAKQCGTHKVAQAQRSTSII